MVMGEIPGVNVRVCCLLLCLSKLTADVIWEALQVASVYAFGNEPLKGTGCVTARMLRFTAFSAGPGKDQSSTREKCDCSVILIQQSLARALLSYIPTLETRKASPL